MKFPESAFAHKYLDGLGSGVEIGGSAHNDYGLPDCINVDYTDDMTTVYKDEERKHYGEAKAVDVVSEGDILPLDWADHFDYLLNSHVIEHMPDTIGCIEEWHRVVKPNGLILFVVPNRDSCEASDKAMPYVTMAELFEDYRIGHTVLTHPVYPGKRVRDHYHQWNKRLFVEMLTRFFSTRLEILDTLDPDDKVGNGFMVVVRVIK